MARTPEESVNTSEKFKNRLLEIIEEHGGKKKYFAKSVGVNIEVILRATKYAIIPSLKSLIKIADTLDCSLDYLLGETEERDFYKTSAPVSFHARIYELAEENKVTYSEITKSMPFASNSIYEWQRKKCLPCLEFLQALAEYFNVSKDYLLGRTDFKN